ncbi:MAG TPA: hypothetical protein VEI53_00670 [Ktedonobacteraceae bacterium]|nr:hypothetical protein [Ktedonobacteraceae bacterium]
MRKSQIEQEEKSNYKPSFPANKGKRGIRQIFTQHWYEVNAAIILGIVLVATAWSGYEATRWSGEQSTRYTQSSALRVESIRNSTLAGLVMLNDSNLFSDWLKAYSHGDTKLANLYEKRFRPEFRSAFEAWLATNPFNNPHAPPGPLVMPQYKVSQSEKADQLAIESERNFAKGQEANEQGDAYVLNTIFLASALFLTAIGERFNWNPIRAVILAVALVMLLFGIYHLIIYPVI